MKLDLKEFRNHLGDRGLSPGTIDVYLRDLKLARASSSSLDAGLVARLRDNELAPKTRRHILAAGRQWAEFSEDAALTKKLKNIRLPPARRRVAKVPLTRPDLFTVIDEISSATYLTDPVRAVLGMMACRGFRCGDVLRMHKSELAMARSHNTLAYEAKGGRRLEFKLLETYRKWLVMLAKMPGDWDRVDELVAREAAPKGRRKAASKAIGRALNKVGKKLNITGLHPHRLRRTYAVEYLRAMKGDPEGLLKLVEHMQWSSVTVAAEYVNHARGDELDVFAEKIFER